MQLTIRGLSKTYPNGVRALDDVSLDIANGMFGLVLVEPESGLPKVEHEFYVMQSEIYALPPAEGTNLLQYSHEAALREQPRFVVFNGSELSLYGPKALRASTGERVRIYFGNAGPNFVSSFHVVGTTFEEVYHDGNFSDPPQHFVQTTLVPAGGASVVEFPLVVPGSYTLLDHSMGRAEQGAMGSLEVAGAPRPDVYRSQSTGG